MPAHQLSRADARRLTLRGQLLTDERPGDLLEVLRRVTVLQNDPTRHVAPSADMADWPGRGELRSWQEDQLRWVEANTACRLDILDRLRMSGPLPVSELPDTCARPWRSSGWNDNRNVVMLINLLVARGEVAAAGREGRETLWDLAERVYPDEPLVPAEEAERVRDELRLRALGIARAESAAVPGEPGHVGEVGEPAVVDGVKGQWRVDPELLDLTFAGRTALLFPLDRLIHDRKRMDEIFEFDYRLEMYKAKDQRRFGYWALPVLYDDRLVGAVDATADRREGELRVDAVHEDAPFPKAMISAVRDELGDLAAWLGLELVVSP